MAPIWPVMQFGNIAGIEGVSPDRIERVQRAVTSYKNVQVLLDIADSFKALPNEILKEILGDSIKKSGGGVAETFFNQSTQKAIFGGEDFTNLRDELAVALVSIDLTSVAKFNFDHVTNGNLAKSKVTQIVRGGQLMGEGLLVEALKKQHGFQQYLNDKKEWVAKLEAILNDVVYIEGTLVKQLSEESILAVKMKLFLLKVLGSNKVEEITKAWVKASSQKLMQSVEDFVNKDSLLLLVNGWLMSQPFSKEVISACVKSHTKSWTSVEPYSPGLSIDHTETSYGDSVRSWLNSSNGPAKYSLLSGREPDNIVKRTHVNNPAGCFLGSASVLLSDSKSVAIENLKEGDKIFGINGGIGVVSSEKVALELDSVTPLFGFNEEEPFFTSSHPFWTQDGWRAVNPHLAKLDNHWLKVGQLTEGDYVRRVKAVKDGKIDYEWLKISAIHFKDFPAGTKVYGVHTREGPRSYHANGYLVCQNYPEITCQNAVDRMSSLSSEEKKTLQKHMDEMEPMLKKVLGPGPSNAMTSLTKRYLTEKMKNDNKARKDRVPLKEMSLPHVNLTYHAGDTKLGSYSMPKKMSLVRGHLFLDEIHVPAAQVTNDNNVTWTRSVPDGKWEHGSVKLHGNRIQGNGFVALTNNQHDTKSVVSASVTATAHVNTYKCYKSVEASTGASQTTAKWTDYGELSMGVDCSSGTCKTVGKVRIPPMDTLDDLGHHVVFTVDAKQQLLVNVVVPSDFWSYFGCTRLSGTFSMDFETFTGTCVSYDENKPTLQGETYFWKGVIEKNLSANTMLESARNISLKSPIHADPVPLLTTPRYQLLDAVDGSSTTDSESTVAPMANTMATMATQSLSVDELYMITPPDSQTVHELTFNLLQEGMKYDMDNTLREKILGVVKPDLSGDMAAVANSYKTFLGDTFANAYMMNALSQSDTYKDKITDEQRNQLLYFWSGNDKDSLAQNADYNKANNDVSRVAYIQSCPEVEKYISSSQGGPYWAKKLYDKLTETEVLNGLALAAEVSETMSIIQKQSMVLFCLSPKEDYGARFYKKVMMTRLNETSTYFRGERGNTVLMKEIFTDSIHQLIVSVLAGGDATTREVTANLRKDLVEAANEMNVEITADSEETANDMLAHMEEFISGVINLFALQSGTAWEALAKSVSKWQERNPIKAGILKFSSVAICSALWITSIYFTVKTFMQWDSLTVEQKVALIADSVDMFVRTIAGIPDMIANFKTSCKNGKLGFKLIKDKIKAQNKPEAANEMEEVVEKNVEKIDGVDEVGVDAVMAEKTAAQLEEAEAVVSNWQKFFSVTEQFAKVTGLIAGVAGCVVVGFQIYRDFSTNAPVAQKALDICQGITLGVATMAAAIGLFVEAACIPIIGIVCAIIGLALAIASLFIHRDPPKPKPTEIDKYVDGKGSNFVNALPKPSQTWLNNYHKAHPIKK